MGVGMNEASKLNGALATVGVASRMISSQIDSDIAAGERAQKDAISVGEEMPGLKKELEAANNQAANVAKEAEALQGLDVKSPEDAAAFEELAAGVDQDQKMAEVALKTVQNKINSRIALLGRAQTAMDRAARWGGNK